ncbi:ketosynthase chain-length factor [Micromonospora wenchangensis]|uniref:Ketosynthase chain-length factor n=1 Tax=Micromonospora wenchangensis TaxID=1185415 RepID=A0A246RTS4_9ACTN|nr:ketosynthase chain-length factor [Micromonospora wenchangensis]OWV11949.1 ketosynthase chain-length factor [Micromonospora wenchangensis]
MTATVITGLGVLAPNGLDTADYWSSVLAGRSAIRRLSHFDPSRYPAVLAGEIHGFDAAARLPSRLLPQTDRMTRLALVAADAALADAGVVPAELPEYGMGVVTASASGGFEFGQNELQNLWSRGGEHVSAYQSFAWFYAVNTGQISIRHGLRGHSGVLVGEQAGGLDALGQARRQNRNGTPLVVTGGVDGSLCPWGWVAQLPSGRLSHSTDPAAGFLPFDERACGHVPGEGGAILIAEELTAARRRGARQVYGEVAGYASTFDPAPGTGGEPGLRRAITLALADADLTADAVDVVFADAAGVAELDLAEAEAIDAVFGPGAVPVTAPKTMTGRLYSGGAPLDLATALLALRHGVIPPTVNVRTPAPGIDLDLVLAQPRPATLRTALVLARGYGGFNSAVLLRTVDH